MYTHTAIRPRRLSTSCFTNLFRCGLLLCLAVVQAKRGLTYASLKASNNFQAGKQAGSVTAMTKRTAKNHFGEVCNCSYIVRIIQVRMICLCSCSSNVLHTPKGMIWNAQPPTLDLQDQYSGNNTFLQRYVLIPPEQDLNSSTPIFLFTANEQALEYASQPPDSVLYILRSWLAVSNSQSLCTTPAGTLELTVDSTVIWPKPLGPCKSGQSTDTMQLRRITHLALMTMIN